MPKQKIRPFSDCCFVYPFTNMLIIRPRRKPKKLPIAKSIPTAEPSPTGKTSSHPSSNMIGTKGIKKKELKAEIKLAARRL